MALTSSQQEKLKGAATNLIYAWISEVNLKYCGTAKAIAIITKKRAYQLEFMRNIANQAGGNYDEVRDYVEQCIIDIYGMTPSEVVYRLAQGQTVRGKNWSEGVFGIGATPKLTFPDSSGYKVSADTGEIMDASGKVLGSADTAMYADNGTLYGYCVQKDGAWYASRYNPSTNLYEAYETTSKDGVITQVSTGKTYTDPSTVATENTIWENAGLLVPFLNQLLKAILALFNVKTVTTDDIKINQVQDEWVAQEQGKTSTASLPLLGGIALLGIIGMSKQENKKGKKQPKQKQIKG